MNHEEQPKDYPVDVNSDLAMLRLSLHRLEAKMHEFELAYQAMRDTLISMKQKAPGLFND